MSDLERVIREYQPTEAAIALVRDTKIALLTGISGAGKDTIKRRLLRSPSFRDIVSHTTREPRANNGQPERDGVDYHFINQSAALTMLRNHQFIEAKFVHGKVYGTSTAELQLAHDHQQTAITDIDVQGVAEYEQLAPGCIAIFIVPPDYPTWLERLKQRYVTEAEFQAAWPKRRQSAIAELSHALEVPYYHVIINDDLNRAVRVCGEIIERGDVFNRRDDEARLIARDLLDYLMGEDTV
jgi:guanylate kinase